jgi:COP9 signalosome complex subunit 4
VVSVLIQHVCGDEDHLRFMLDQISLRSAAFEEQITSLRETLATVLEAQHDFMEAARILQAIPLESGQRSISNEYKLQIYIRILRCLLEEDETAEADAYLNRASHLVTPTTKSELLVHFKLCQARIFDARRRFIDAGTKYFELSLMSDQIAADERQACLAAALVCAVLSPAGPARSALLSTLYAGEETRALEHFSILEKMFLERLITPQELELFASTLRPHQMALLPDGTTVLTRAAIEHNVLAAAKVYDNVATDTLAKLLDLTPAKAERFARGMIESGRLKGKIDQVSGIIEFQDASARQQGPASARWDASMASLLSEVEAIASAVTSLTAS